MPDPTLERSIAVIGMAGRFPGADDVAGLWRNLRAGAAASVTLSDAELRAAGVPEHVIEDPDYVKRRPMLSGIDLFDAGFFGFLPREAELLDPQQRLFLECAWHALEDSGHARDCRETGVFAGAAISTYLIRNLLHSAAVRDGTDMSQLVFANDKDHLATRTGYKLDLHGPCIAVSSACSTSLVAVHVACRILLGYQCDMALAGGAAVVVPQAEGYLYRDGGMASPDGLCRAFDAAARGTVFGSGVGVVALRRYEDAVRDGDHIYAVIRGSAVNNDGAGKVGYTAPAVEGQAAVIAEALAVADVEPGTVSYIEAHGTGTPLGDPIELRALRKAFGDVGGRRGFCALGSVKTNVGHLDAASGVTGLIKTARALHAKELPPSLNFVSADTELGLEDSPFRVQTRLDPWPSGATPRRAGVSSFGVGGTNAHVVLEEAPQRPTGSEPIRGAQLLTLSARSDTALARMGENLADHLAAVPDGGASVLADIAFSLAVGRRDFDHRRSVLARDPAEAARLLRAPDPAHVFEGRLSEGERAVVFLFPGQGAQRVGMGASLYRAEPVFRAQIDRCAELLRPVLRLDLRDVLYPAPEQSAAAAAALDRTAVTQPALFAVEYALARLWMDAYGIRPSALIGHSLGEYVAACIAGVFSLEDALTLVAERGRLMQALPAGAMAAVALGADEAAPLLLPGVSIAAVNAPDRCVVSGALASVEALLARLAEAGVEAVRLRTSHAFHSAMMDPVLDAFRATVGAVRLTPPRIPIISNLSGGWLADDEATAPDYWVRHLRQAVNFAAGLRTLSTAPRRLYLEVGPGRTLSRLAAGQGASGAVATALLPGDVDAAAHALATLGRLWSLGAAVDWTAFYQAERRLRVPLPLYPFERRRYWISPDAAASAASAAPPAPVLHPVPVVAEVPADGMRADGVSADGVRAVLRNLVPAVAEAPADGVPADGVRADGARANGVRTALRKIVAEASGLLEAELDPACSFLDLGFDSLALIQVNQNIRRRLGVDIPFRDLMDRLPSIDSLAAHLDAVLPAVPAGPPHGHQDKVAKEVTPPPLKGGSWGEGAYGHLSASSTPPPNPLPQGEGEHIVLRSAAYPDAYTVPPPAAPIPTVVPVAPAALGPAEVGLAPTALDYATAAPAPAADALDPRQQRYLADLTARYTARTTASKRAAQEYRPALADARVSMGFRRRWKEMLYPLVVTRAAGAHIWDADGNQYIDLLMGFGVNLFGHWPDFIQQALHAAIEQSPQLVGPQSPLAGPVARRFCEITGNDRATFCNTGSEAVMTAIRLARTATGRDRIALFRNSYHGNIDSVIVRPRGTAGAVPAALGIPQHAADDIVVLDYCTEAALDYLDRHGADIAAVLVEPVQCRRPELDPRGFLRDLRRVADRTGTLLVFDEVVTGFRIHAGGAQARFGVQADLATYGKVLGGGMPIGVVAGRAAVMDAIDGGMWAYGDDSFPRANQTAFAGTFCKHPFAVAAAGAVLDHVATQGPRLQQDLGARTDRLVTALQACCDEEHAPIGVQSFASIFKFTPAPDFHHLDLFFYELRSRGISVWEERPYFLSTAHTDADIDGIVQATAESLAALRRGGILSARPQRAPAGRIPLTSPQREVWAASMLGADASAAYTITAAMRLSGILDAEALGDALNRVIARHEALRTVLDADGIGQRFAPRLTFDLTPEDLSALPADRRAALLDARLEHEAQTAFDLAQSPLLRAGLLRLGEREHVLALAAHHIVCDGISMDIVFRELVALYLDATGGAAARLEPPLRFGEYVAWQQERRASGAADAARDHWAARLADGVPVLDLPLAQPRPRVPGTSARRETLVLDGTALPGLRAAGRRLGATSLVTLMTCFAILLHRLTNQDRLVIGLPVTGRSALGGGPLVGHCVNLVPVPVEIDGALSFAAILARVREGVLAAQEHWDVTPGELATALRLPRDPGRPLLAAVTFNLETAPAQLDCGGLTLAPVPAPKPFVQFEMELNAIDSGSAITLTCDYNAGLFDGATVRRWLGYLREVALSAAREPGMAVGRLPLLTAAERRALLPAAAVAPRAAAASWPAAAPRPAPHRRQDKPDVEKNTPPPLVGGGWGEGLVGGAHASAPPPSPLPQGEGEYSSPLSAAYPKAYPDAYGTAPEATLHRWFEQRAAAAPAAVAVTTPGEARAGLPPASLTYGALNARANRLARHLRALGVGPETPVGLCLDRTPDIVVGLLGILKAGGAYLPLDPNFPPERIAFMLTDARATVVLTTDAVWRSLPREGCLDSCVAVSLDGDAAAFDRLPDGDLPGGAMAGNAAYVIYTSGSTGQPKGVVVTHTNVARLFTATQDAFAFGAHDVWTCVHSYAFDFSVWETWGALLFGGRLVVVPHWIVRDPDALWALIDAEHVTVLSQTPSAFRQLVAVADSHGPADLRLVVFGGEALDFRSLGPWFARCGDARPALVNMYGITETTVHVTCRPLAAPDALLPTSLIGEALPDLGMAILDRYLEPAPPGVAGEIHVSGAGLARGYLGRPALTAERFVPDPHGPPGGRLYRTGDLARRLPQGDVEYLGRLDHQVQLRGYRVEAGEIEAALRAEGAREAAVVLRAGDDGHQRLVAYVAMDPATEAGIAPPILRDRLARRLPDYMVPALFVALPALPKTATGKIDRAALPVPAAGTAAPVDRQEPRSAAERVLAAIWAEALGLPAVGINENFFELGGDSIINIQVVARARRASLRFGPRDLFANPTVAGLAAIAQPVDPDGGANAERGPAVPGVGPNASRTPVPGADPNAGRAPVPTPVPTPPGGPIPLLPMQCWFLHRDPVDPDYFTQSVLLEVPAHLDADHLRRALDAVVGHHAALRLRFSHDADGRWTQVAGPAALAARGVGFAVVDAIEAMTTAPAATEAAAHAARAAVNLAQGPLVQARLLRTGAPGPRPDRLLIAIHHLVTDGVTWRVLLSDLETAYRQACQGEAIVLPPCGTSLAAWAHRLRDRAASPAEAAQLDYWLESARVELRALPVDRSDGPDTVASERRVTVGLPASRTRALLTAGLRRPDATAEEILLTALAIALSRFCGTSDVLVDVEAHGREDDYGETDLSRTAGWLTALYPLVLHLPAPAAPHTVLRAVQEQFRAVPERGLGYGLLRYLSPGPAVGAGLAQAPQAEVLWNYLGQLRREESADRCFGVVTRPGGFDRSPRAPRTHAIEINALIDSDALQVEFAYSAARHDRTTIETLAADYLVALRDLIGDSPAGEDTPAGGDTLAGHDTSATDDTPEASTTNATTTTAGRYAPSDFPDAELSEHDLAVLVAELEREEARTP